MTPSTRRACAATPLARQPQPLASPNKLGRMFASPNKLGRWPATLLATAALLGAGAAPAWAGTTTLPGAMCHSDGAVVDRPTTGALLNGVSSPSSGTTKFHCPVIRTEPVSNYGGTLTLRLYARVNYSYTSFECVLRATTPDGTLADSATFYVPSKATGNGGYASTAVSVTLPPIFPASVNLRCNVPNMYAGELAGIMSYTVTD